MVSNPYPKPKIQDEGLKAYLNRTADKHNGKRYKDFAEMIDKHINKTSMARLFGVDTRTISKYIAIYEAEKTKT